jgi:hypothetical protein
MFGYNKYSRTDDRVAERLSLWSNLLRLAVDAAEEIACAEAESQFTVERDDLVARFPSWPSDLVS